MELKETLTWQCNINSSFCSDNDPEVLFGELSKNCLLQLNNVMELAYQPMIDRLEAKHWGKCEPEYVEEFNSSTAKFANECSEAIKQLAPG